MWVMGLGRERSPHASPPSLEPLDKKGIPSASKKKNKRIAPVLIAGGIAGAAIFGDGFSKDMHIAQGNSEPMIVGHGFSGGGGALSRNEIPPPIEAVTFNTASGSPRIKTPQAEFVNLPFYQKAINGASDAPIIGLQEVGPAQHKKISEMAKKNDNFSYIYINSKGSNDGNLLIIPKRYEVLEGNSSPYQLDVQVNGMKSSLLSGAFKPQDVGQLYPRMWSEARLKDRVSGNVFTVFNTHLSYVQSIQRFQSDVLFEKVRDAKKHGPVLLMGDLNADTRSFATNGKRLQANIAEAGMTDVSPRGKMNIDYVLGSGFKKIEGKILHELSLPGSPTAEQVSDHYAEQVVVRFDHVIQPKAT